MQKVQKVNLFTLSAQAGALSLHQKSPLFVGPKSSQDQWYSADWSFLLFISQLKSLTSIYQIEKFLVLSMTLV